MKLSPSGCRINSLAVKVRFGTFGTIALLLISGSTITIALYMMGIVVLLNFCYMTFMSLHILSEVTRRVFTPNIDDGNDDHELQERLREMKTHMSLPRRVLLTIFSPTLVAFHRQRVIAERHAVHLVWQGLVPR